MQAVLGFALDPDDLGRGRTARTAGRNFNVEINPMLRLTVSTISLSPKRLGTVFQNVLAKLLELFVVVRSQQAVKVSTHKFPGGNGRNICTFSKRLASIFGGGVRRPRRNQ
jgi:hypothetical protein